MAEGGNAADPVLNSEQNGDIQEDGDWDEEYDDEVDIEDVKMTQESSDDETEEEQLDESILQASDDESDDESSKGESDDKKKILNDIKLVSRYCNLLYVHAPRIDLNLMHDFTESDLFTIDGDSILADIFAQQGLDFSHGGQLLHLIYLVELFLQDFQDREGQFHIIFFTEAEAIWHGNPLQLLARRAIIQHLTHNTKCHLVTDIPHPYSQEWIDYIDRYHPAFIMLSDGESLTHTGHRMLIHALLMSAVRLDIDCAFCSTLRRSLRSVNTFYVEARKVDMFFLRYKKSSLIAVAYEQATLNYKKERAQSYTDQELTKVCDQLLSSVEKRGDNKRLVSTIRDVITVIACAEVMKGAFDMEEQEDTDKAFTEGAARACLLHAILLQYLPLDARGQNTPDDDQIAPDFDGLMNKFLEKMHYAMARQVASYGQLCKKLTGIDGVKETKSLADLMDGRLLYVTLYQLQKYTENDIQASYPAEVLAKFRYLWAITHSMANTSNDVSPSGEQQLEDKSLLSAPVHIYKSASKELGSDSVIANNNKGLVPVSSELVTDYAGDLLKELESKSEVKLHSATASPRAFEEKYHWHSGKPLKDHFQTTKEEKWTASISNDQIAELIKELKTPQLQELYVVLGLQSREIVTAGAKSSDKEYQAKKVLEYWRRKERLNATTDTIVEALDECQYNVARDKLQAKWSRPVQLSDYERKRKQKQEQLHARYMHNYGTSLEGKSHGLTQQTITVDKSKNTTKSKQGGGGHQGQKNKQTVKNRDKYRQAKDQKDRDKADADSGAKWSAILPDIKLEISRSKYKAAVKRMDDFIDHCTSDKWKVEVMLAKMDCYWLAWKIVKTERKTSEYQLSTFSDVTDKHPMYFPIMLFICCQEVLEFKETLNTKQFELIGAYMKGLGFHSFADQIQGMANSKSASHKGSARQMFSSKPPGEDECAIGMTCTRFQLQFVGQWMKRNVRTDKDERVPYFIPDTWQRELLDVVDRNESALIVAPTSSGKTYASYYCMEKVLRQGDDGVVVYVSPTKALMNQVAATVYARFSKKLPPGMHVTGLFSRDFRRNALTCQILVTVPQCLEILLLSPCRQEWAKRIQYIIFDEVHCLGGEIGAEVWEHLLVAIRCPFLALSATVRNPEDIRGWLQGSQDFKQLQAEEVLKQSSKKKTKKKVPQKVENKFKVALVVWKERHSDLEKYVYLPKTQNDEVIMPNDQILLETGEFVPIHPVAVLDLKKVKSQGLPADFSLSPRETLVLYDTMKEVYPDCQNLKALDPEVYFKNIPVLKKQDPRNYQRKLTAELLRWIQKEEDVKQAIRVINKLKEGIVEKEQAHKEQETRIKPFSNDAALVNYPKLVRQLNEQNKLPALVFSQNRALCEGLAFQIAESLAKTEAKIREDFEQTEQWKFATKIMARLEKVAKRSKDKEANDKTTAETEEEKGPARLAVQWKNNDYQDAERFAACLSAASDSERKVLLGCKHYLLDEPLPSCTLQGEGNLTREEVNDILSRLPYGETSDTLRRLIKRGVAYHHAGLNNKLRVAVETLFRMKHLKVVTATATLALGIHMPCKTVVFACEDLWLKPLAYRQMSGRSGRRGFDLVGNVIFFCVPPQKIEHLITSGLPHLRGHFPFSVSLVLRLMVLTHNSEDKRDAHEKVLTLLKHPFVCHKAKDMEEVVKHFFLFSVDYLIHAGLLDVDGTPIGLSGLATHLFYHEPANLTFVTMLQEGAFHQLCRPKKDGTFSQSVMETMVLVLAHMFGRKMMPMSTVQSIKKEGVHSKIVFDKSLPMPSTFSAILRKHNKDVSEVFRSYVHTVCDYAARRGDSIKQNVLPLSKVAIQPPADTSSSDVSADQGNLVTKLEASANHSTTLSPFVMTSGHTDNDLPKFDADISQAIRQGVHIEHSKIPTLVAAEDLEDNRGKPLLVNAYAYDFFIHGSKKVIEKENRLMSGEVFDSLKDFNLVIAAISVALEELGPEEDNVVLAFKQLKKEYHAKFKLQYGV